MTSNSENNKRIAKNTLMLYVRMALVVCIGLYTVRAILHILGETNYGLYNVVGGFVGMFQFINGTLSSSSQRYFSIYLAKNDEKRLNNWFCLNITMFFGIIVALVFICETVGLWFVNTQMTIPAERMLAANIVYQLSVLSFSVSLFNVPYLALIIAHEQMSAFAYIGIFEAISKLVIVFMLTISPWDKLVVYAVLMLLASCSITTAYMLYCRRHFPESKYKFFWDYKAFKELASFSGWNVLGTTSVVVRGQGINLLISTFFNPAVNAARGIAFHIEGTLMQFNNNFFMAVEPQIYKYYATGEFTHLRHLIERSTIMCMFLSSVLSLPLCVEAHYVLNLWLVEVPQYTVPFMQWVLLNGIVDSVGNSMIAPALATGRIRNFYLVTGTLYILTLPISWVVLRMGASPVSTVIVTLVVSVVTAMARVYFLRGLVKMPLRHYSAVLLKLAFWTCFILLLLSAINHFMADSFIRLVLVTAVSILLHVCIYYYFIFSPHDRQVVTNMVKQKLLKKK